MWKTVEKLRKSRLSAVDYFVGNFRLINSLISKKLINNSLSNFPHANVEKI